MRQAEPRRHAAEPKEMTTRHEGLDPLLAKDPLLAQALAMLSGKDAKSFSRGRERLGGAKRSGYGPEDLMVLHKLMARGNPNAAGENLVPAMLWVGAARRHECALRVVRSVFP